MKNIRTSILGTHSLAAAALSLLAVSGLAAPTEPAEAPHGGPAATEASEVSVAVSATSSSVEGEIVNGWIVDESDNVCGVRPARQITNPALVRYEDLLDATPEIQRMKREGIRRDSAQGQVLYAAAVDRIAKAARRVMGSRQHCSVWKEIRNRDGRSVPDISEDVKAEL